MSCGCSAGCVLHVAARISACLTHPGLGWRWCCWVLAWVFETHHLLCNEEHNMALEGALKLQGYSQLHMKMQGAPHT